MTDHPPLSKPTSSNPSAQPAENPAQRAADWISNCLNQDTLGKRWISACDERTSPITAIVLGSGLGGLADSIESSIAIDYASIPGFAKSTASGHRGQLIFGFLNQHRVVAMAGRLHRYEGWTNRQVAFPIHVMHRLGAQRLITSNAAGGVSPRLRVGDIIVIRDHIDWLYPSAGKKTRRVKPPQTRKHQDAFQPVKVSGPTEKKTDFSVDDCIAKGLRRLPCPQVVNPNSPRLKELIWPLWVRPMKPVPNTA